MDGGGFLSSVSKRKDLPDDLACFLQQQKQRQARLETTMRSFPSTGDMEQDKMDQKKKRSTHEVRIILTKFLFVKIYTYSIVDHSNNKIKLKTLQYEKRQKARCETSQELTTIFILKIYRNINIQTFCTLG